MKNFILGLIVATLILVGSVIVFAATNFSDISPEALWNRVFDSTNNKINVIGV